MPLIRAVVSMSWFVLVGCALPSNHVIFVTKTSLGIDVESTPPGASIAYDRTEGYIGPRYDNGAVPPVAGSFVTNGKLLDRQIKQLYATGNAARTVTQSTAATNSATEKLSGNHKVMFFGTGTVLGIKLGFGIGGLVESFTLGYKRKETSVIPVAENAFPSVIAMLDTNVEAASQAASALHIEQFFATGIAADALAKQSDISDAFTTRARIALAEYREDERLQSRFALDTLYCMSILDDSQLPKVWRNAETVDLFDDKTIPPKLRAAPAHDARMRYTSELGILNPKSGEHTGVMRGHRAYVCELAGK
jgi:hypothetical protein